jgi:hypothetical protein
MGAERLKGALFLLDGKAIKCTLDNEGVARYGVGPDDGRRRLCARASGRSPISSRRRACRRSSRLPGLRALHFEALEIKSAAEVPRLRKRTDPRCRRTPAGVGRRAQEISGAHRMRRR